MFKVYCKIKRGIVSYLSKVRRRPSHRSPLYPLLLLLATFIVVLTTGFSSSGYEVNTYANAVGFLASNTVSDNVYNQGIYGENNVSYNCFSFVADLMVDAKAAGFKCGLVWVDWTLYPIDQPISYYLHVMIAFDTIDKGIIFVEPRTDEIIALAVGKEYMMGKVTNMVIIW